MGLFGKKREPMDAAFLARFPQDQSIRNEVMLFTKDAGGMTFTLAELGYSEVPSNRVELAEFVRTVGLAAHNKGWDYDLNSFSGTETSVENNAIVLHFSKAPERNSNHWHPTY